MKNIFCNSVSTKNFTSQPVKVQTIAHKQAKCDVNKALILGAKHKQISQLNSLKSF